MNAAKRDDDADVRAMMSREQVLEKFPISPSTLFRMCQAKTFPKPVRLGAKRWFWYRDEVEAFQKALKDDPVQDRNLQRKTARRAKPGRQIKSNGARRRR